MIMSLKIQIPGTIVSIFMLIASLLGPPGSAYAGTSTGSLTISVTITASCTVAAASIGFGSIDATLISTTASSFTAGTISVTCTGSTPWAVGFGSGNNYQSSTRRMVYNSVNYIGYGLYASSNTTNPLGTATNSTTCAITGDCLTGTGTGTGTIYGYIPATTTPPVAGLYTDTVTMTIIY